ncbi:hypothetical protein C8R45DRAFT_1017138 [Mycena sanguinolenta]|nr:hypothetical protein C8R45DRAFT_1017138 [Mycena sanguinolenta]
MGRRKIEIQPITHERNRSVTFLKRKNGLFKKAYELGVLCSVDVAVIIFEERPGHQHKLYQYCSTDIRDIVSRHVEHDGERDTRVPADFSGGPKAADADADDDEDADEEEAPPPPPPPKRTKSKVSNKDKDKDDMDYRGSNSGMAIPSPPISIRKLPSTKSTSIPTSSDRDSARSSGKGNGMRPPASKKPRIAPSSRSSDEESNDNSHSSNLTLPPLPPGSGYNFPSVPQYRGAPYGLPPHPGGAGGSPFFPSLFDAPPPPPSFRGHGQYDPMLHHLLRNQTRAPNPSPANPFGVDWPVHAPGAGTGTQVPPPHDPTNWLDFLSGTPLPPGTLGGAGSSRSGTTSWERGGGGGSGGSGEGRSRKRAQSESRSSSEPGPDDMDG